MIEFALAFPLLVLVALALVQLALYVHAENVVIGAAQDGARVAAEVDRGIPDGLATSRTLLQAGLGAEGSAVNVQGADNGSTVTITASGSLPVILPLVGGVSLPLHARATMSKEQFVVAPSE
jgi:Flp pilus assembly protein TadG